MGKNAYFKQQNSQKTPSFYSLLLGSSSVEMSRDANLNIQANEQFYSVLISSQSGLRVSVMRLEVIFHRKENPGALRSDQNAEIRPGTVFSISHKSREGMCFFSAVAD